MITMNREHEPRTRLRHFAGVYGDTQADYFEGRLNSDGFSIRKDKRLENERLNADCPEYAFNEYLQIGVECGTVVMAVFIVLLFANE